jgi:hypothetical protein
MSPTCLFTDPQSVDLFLFILSCRTYSLIRISEPRLPRRVRQTILRLLLTDPVAM